MERERIRAPAFKTFAHHLGKNSVICAKTYLPLFIVDYFPLITISNRNIVKTLVNYRLPMISKNIIYFLVDSSDVSSY